MSSPGFSYLGFKHRDFPQQLRNFSVVLRFFWNIFNKVKFYIICSDKWFIILKNIQNCNYCFTFLHFFWISSSSSWIAMLTEMVFLSSTIDFIFLRCKEIKAKRWLAQVDQVAQVDRDCLPVKHTCFHLLGSYNGNKAMPCQGIKGIKVQRRKTFPVVFTGLFVCFKRKAQRTCQCWYSADDPSLGLLFVWLAVVVVIYLFVLKTCQRWHWRWSSGWWSLPASWILISLLKRKNCWILMVLLRGKKTVGFSCF